MTAWETAMQQIRELKAENERLRELLAKAESNLWGLYRDANETLRRVNETFRMVIALKKENQQLRAERDDYREAIERALAEHDDTKTLVDVLSKWEAIGASGKEVTEAAR
jgi:DNA repair exonuclease SbcCD ATPase subunit